MSWLTRILNVFRVGGLDRALDDEIQFHIDSRTDELIAAGMTRERAAATARRQFGNRLRVREASRDIKLLPRLDDARRDFQYAWRTLTRDPGFSAVAVLTLAVGIGSVTVIYSVLHNVLLDPLPYRDSQRLVNVLLQDTQTGRTRTTFSPGEFLDLTAPSGVFEGVIGTLGDTVMYATGERVEPLRGVWVTPNFFEFMGLSPFIGRTFSAADATAGAQAVVVLRHRAWVRYFNGDPNVVGRTILLNGEPRTVIGVMPQRFTWHAADLWLPKPVTPGPADPHNPVRNFQARLKPGITIREAEAQMNLIAARRAREHPAEYPARFRIQVVNVIEFTVGGFGKTLYTLMAAVGLLLLVACSNVANMLLARATVREREISIRAALGAGRWRIVRQLLMEGLLLAIGGAIGGTALAYVAIERLVPLLPATPLPGEVMIGLNRPVLAFSLATAVVSALIFGTAPAVFSARRDLVEALKSGGKGIAAGRGRLRNALVAAEIAMSLVLLLGAGLLMRTFVSLIHVDLGFDPQNILVIPPAFAPGQYANRVEKQRFYSEALQRIGSVRGVVAAAATTSIPPFPGGFSSEMSVPGQSQAESRIAAIQLCTPDYFRAVGIRVLRGTGLPELGPGDERKLAVVSQRTAREYFAGEDPIGRYVRLTSRGTEPNPLIDGDFLIAGVVDDVKDQGVQAAPGLHVYLPGAARAAGNPLILVRTHVDPAMVSNDIRAAIAAADPSVAIRDPRTLEWALEQSVYSQPRFTLVVLGLFAVAATVLVAIGVFSVMAYTVSRQTREIAVRVALGARAANVMTLVFRSGARLLAVGVAIGVAASYATDRLVATQLSGTAPQDPWTTAGAVLVISVVSLAACYVPARRALRVDPITVLRHE
jgi:putative ABC transport system permease protein